MPFTLFGVALGGGGGSGVVDFATIGAAPTLFDTGSRVDRPSTEFNTSMGRASFFWNGSVSNAIVGGHTIQGTPRYSWQLSTLLPAFDPAQHMLFVRLSDIFLTDNPHRMGLAVFISDQPSHTGSGGGGVATVDFTGNGLDDRPGESSSTSTSTGTATGGQITTLDSHWKFGADGDVSVECLVNADNSTTGLRNRGTRRDINFPGGRPAASALHLQLATIKLQTGLLTDDDLARATISLAYSTLPV